MSGRNSSRNDRPGAGGGAGPLRLDQSFAVTPEGAATLRIPLWIPPGRAGIQPRVELNYDSRNGNSLLGVGWGLSAASSIVRVARDRFYDAAAGAITFSQKDPFALDGLRMILVKGVHGQDGAEYRTHVDVMSRITLNAPDEFGPASFTVFANDGRIMTYGPSDDTRLVGRRFSVIVPPSGAAASQTWTIEDDLNNIGVATAPVRFGWLLQEVRDRCGNAMEYIWSDFTSQAPPDSTGYRPSTRVLREIRYTSRRAKRADRDPQRKVTFEYVERDDPSEAFSSGYRTWRIALLTRIDTWVQVENDLSRTRSYVLEYVVGSSGRSLLSSIGLFGSDDSQSQLIPVQKFEYQTNPGGFLDIDTGITDVRTSPGGRSGTPGRVYVMDIDGDGRDDIFYPSATNVGFYSFRLARTDSNGYPCFSVEHTTGIPLSVRPERPMPLDLDARGRVGLLCFDDTQAIGDGIGIHYSFYKPVGAGINSTLAKTAEFDVNFAEITDLDGDGQADLITTPYSEEDQLTYVWSYAINDAGNFGPPKTIPWVTPDDHLFLDIDGDGASELLTCLGELGGPGTVGQWLSAIRLGGDGPPTFETTSLLTRQQYLFTDLTGDGLADAVWEGTAISDPPSVARNTGNGFLPPMAQPFIYGYYPDGQSGGPVKRRLDYDLDGKGEIIIRYNSTLTSNPVLLVKWNGASFSPPNVLPIGSTCYKPEEVDVFEVLDVNGNGLDDLIMYNNGSLHLYVRNGARPDLLTKSVDGFGAITTIEYRPVSDDTVYDRAVASVPYPARQNVPRLWVVALHTQDNGNGGANHYRHRYGDSRTDLRRPGQIAFSKYTRTHIETGEEYSASFDLSDRGAAGLFALAGRPTLERTSVTTPAGTQHVFDTITEYGLIYTSSGGSYFVYPETQTAKEGLVDSAGFFYGISSYTDTQTVDEYANIVTSKRVWSDGRSRLVSRTFDNRVADWLIGLKTFEQTTDATVKGATVVRSTAQVFDQLGLLAQSISEPGDFTNGQWQPLANQADGARTLYRRIVRNPEGLTKSSTLSVSPVASPTDRVDQYEYDAAEGIFITQSVNALGQTSKQAWATGLGLVSTATDPNGLIVSLVYDAFGRLTKRSAPGGVVDFAGFSGTPFGPMTHTTQRTNGARRTTLFDVLGRVMRESVWQRDDGKEVRQENNYDDLGRLAGKSLPHFPSSPVFWMRVRFDLLNRPLVLFMPDGTSWSYTYGDAEAPPFESGQLRRTSIIDPRGSVRTIFYDEAKRPTASEEKNANTILANVIAYGPFDNPLSFGVATAQKTVLTYDRLGRVTKAEDPNRGVRIARYSAFGELEQLSDAGQQIDFGRDRLGRIKIVGHPGAWSSLLWDSQWIGSLALSESIDGTRVDFKYDSLGRLHLKRFTTSEGVFRLGYRYDAVSRLASIVYPKAYGPPVRIRYNYGGFGQLMSVDEMGSGMTLWTVVACDATGRFGQWKLGNGATESLIEDSGRPGYLKVSRAWRGATKIQFLGFGFDACGNLSTRVDALTGVMESFQYDAPGRLTQWTYQAPATSGTVEFGYDSRWNLRSRSGKKIEHFDPEVGNGGPDAAAKTSFGHFKYDGKGNRVLGPSGYISYTWRDLPATMKHDGSLFEFEYAVLGRRIVKRRKQPIDVTVTIESFFESRTRGSHVERRFKVQLPGSSSVEIVDTKDGTQPFARNVYFLHTDHIGSIRTISTYGPKLERLAYDPFGRRNDPTAPDEPGLPPPSGTSKGFAGHEHDDELGLVNMLGRIYDPALCRFLTPDPKLRDISLGRNLNPYAYALNNPVTFRDPTGFDADDDEENDKDDGDDGDDDDSAASTPPVQSNSQGTRSTSDNGVDWPAVRSTVMGPNGPETLWEFSPITITASLPPEPAVPSSPETPVPGPDLNPASMIGNAFSGILGLIGTDWGGGPFNASQITYTAHLPSIGESPAIAVEFASPVTLSSGNWLSEPRMMTTAGRALTWASGAASFGGFLMSGWNLYDAVQRKDTLDGVQASVDGLFAAAGVAPLIPEIFAGAAAFLPAAMVMGVGSATYSSTQLVDQLFGTLTGRSLTDRIAGVDNTPHFSP